MFYTYIPVNHYHLKKQNIIIPVPYCTLDTAAIDHVEEEERARVPRTVSDSLAQGEAPRCRIPSSVMSSQWERERDSRQGHWAASWDSEASVIRMHSSRSIRSSLWQHRARA